MGDGRVWVRTMHLNGGRRRRWRKRRIQVESEGENRKGERSEERSKLASSIKMMMMMMMTGSSSGLSVCFHARSLSCIPVSCGHRSRSSCACEWRRQQRPVQCRTHNRQLVWCRRQDNQVAFPLSLLVSRSRSLASNLSVVCLLFVCLNLPERDLLLPCSRSSLSRSATRAAGVLQVPDPWPLCVRVSESVSRVVGC